ncbi:hypothetical protein DERP_004845 [Dermatophagoides pteronyssinus]|uniref:Uncharacterized protein n=1 Tax=Dermatophagoides pteronyssinus TaxID=6956 RepID=A0ABQ8JSP9_DERPT|nr:hypothetical protein DERP_004845 [Dermatophagoides pteronyssinus]
MRTTNDLTIEDSWYSLHIKILWDNHLKSDLIRSRKKEDRFFYQSTNSDFNQNISSVWGQTDLNSHIKHNNNVCDCLMYMDG